jgi:hypothetical protein
MVSTPQVFGLDGEFIGDNRRIQALAKEGRLKLNKP